MIARKVFLKKKLSERSTRRSSDSLSSEVFITMHRSYDGMGGTQVTDRPQANPNVEQQHSAAIASADLLQGRRQVWIDHDGTLYCLKATSNGRLYLTK
ncbi:Hemin uptake protein hemP [Bremerella volcania]|uniref:Hemin uptake protein hemP n=2 Tax=Bremerella volcania TaxID=2527984 RepID=A0A518C2M3_9BACT|nr:Hemin uptake protein hemP [Bremerella volcania]